MTSNPKASPKQKSISEDSPAKTFRLPTKESASVLPDREADSSLSSQNSSLPQSLDGFLSKTFPDSSTQTTEKISEPCSPNWMSSGIAYHGEYWTQNTLEHPNDVAASILSEVLETSAPLRYFLDKEQLESLLNRAEARTTPMPQDLKKSLESQITTLSNTPGLAENLQRARRQKDIEMTEKLTLAIQEEAPTLFVRRMLPLEYERLQGFPDDWTLVDGQL